MFGTAALGLLHSEIAYQTGSTISTTMHTLYDGPSAWADLRADRNLAVRYFNADENGLRLARIRSDGTIAWYVTDLRGTVRLLVGTVNELPTAAFKQVAAFDPSGSPRLSSSAEVSLRDRWRNMSAEYDEVTGFSHRFGFYNETKTGLDVTFNRNIIRYGDTRPDRNRGERPADEPTVGWWASIEKFHDDYLTPLGWDTRQYNTERDMRELQERVARGEVSAAEVQRAQNALDYESHVRDPFGLSDFAIDTALTHGGRALGYTDAEISGYAMRNSARQTNAIDNMRAEVRDSRAGFTDGLTLSISRLTRHAGGFDDVNYNSALYKGSEVMGMVAQELVFTAIEIGITAATLGAGAPAALALRAGRMAVTTPIKAGARAAIRMATRAAIAAGIRGTVGFVAGGASGDDGWA